MELEKSVAQHCAHGTLEGTIFSSWPLQAKISTASRTPIWRPVDEFHIGGRQAAIDFAAEREIEQGLRLLDIGSGLGGASRYFAD